VLRNVSGINYVGIGTNVPDKKLDVVGDAIISDIHMAEWKNIQSIVEKSTVGIKLISIKKYINEQIEYCLKSGDCERQRRFLGSSSKVVG